jgi:purine-binding chemotaxis protein CheW
VSEQVESNELEQLDAEEDTQREKYLTFHLSDETYGIEIRHVREIIGIQKITEVPEMPDFLRGVINLRGQVIPVMDVRTRFKMDRRDYDDRTCVIVVEVQDSTMGLVVDTVSEVADIPDADVQAPPKVKKAASSRYIKGMGKTGDEVKILLDADKLLYEDEALKMAEAVA